MTTIQNNSVAGEGTLTIKFEGLSLVINLEAIKSAVPDFLSSYAHLGSNQKVLVSQEDIDNELMLLLEQQTVIKV